ncbi:MAG: hypothetical protein AB2L24_22770 [Mangrovibacterium sp.]
MGDYSKLKTSVEKALDDLTTLEVATLTNPAKVSIDLTARSSGDIFTAIRHVGELIGKGIKRVIRTLKKLFRWFKNTAQVIWRELKEVYSVMSRPITFFFSKRTITTDRGRRAYCHRF